MVLSLQAGFVLANTVEGRVYDAQTGESLPGVNVHIKGTSIGTITNYDGFYQLQNVREGVNVLVASYIGYDNVETEITVVQDGELVQDFHLSYGAYSLSEVSITVQARGQFSAINQQIRSLSISNIVAAERIQELPDATAAEAVGRLPGVSIISDSGEGNRVVIRGMDPRFNLVTINGVRAPSADEGANAVGLAGISPFMIAGIEIQKSLTPDKDGDAVGGIVDLKLRDAEPGFSTNVVFQNNINNIIPGSNFNPRATLQLGNRFLDDRLGVIFVGNYENIDRSSQRMNVSSINIEDLQASNKYIAWQTVNYSQNLLNRERLGASLFLDYRLPNGKISANNFTSGLIDNNYDINENFNERGRSYNKTNNIRRSNTISVTNNLKLEHSFLFNSNIEVGVSHSMATRDTPKNYSIAQSFIQSESDAGGFFPTSLNYILTDNNVNPYDYALIAPYLRDSSFYITNLNASDNLFKEDELTLRADWRIPVTFANDIISGFFKVGGQFREKNRDYDYNERGADLTVGGAEQIKTRIRQLNPEINFGGFSDYVYTNLPSFPIIDQNLDNPILDDRINMSGYIEADYINQLVSRMEDDNWSSVPGGIVPFRQLFNDYSGNERVYAGYGMTEFNITPALLFVGGLRYEKLLTNYKSYGVYEMGHAAANIEEFGDDMAKSENTFWLPMFNLKIMPVSWMDIRLAYTHSIARPQYYSYMPRYRVSRNGAMTNIGNPDLLPALSQNIDVYVSFLANRLGLLTFGGFYKIIEGYEFTKSFPNLNDASNEVHGYDVIATNRQAPFRVPINNPHDAYTWGMEADWQTVFWYLPEPLNGLVFNINYTIIETEQTHTTVLLDRIVPDPNFPRRFELVPRDSTYLRPLYNQPRGILNVSLGYDYRGFSARLAHNRRSSVFISELGGQRDKIENFRDGSAYSQWDLSVTQNVPRITGLQLFLNMTNISNSFNEETIGDSNTGGRFPLRHEYYGRLMILGLRYNL